MTALVWDQVGERIYQTGVDRGVLYLRDGIGVPWNGITGVEESSTVELKSYYFEGTKYLETLIPGDFTGKLKAITYPEEFDQVNGMLEVAEGLTLFEQPAKQFNLSYRTKVGDDVQGLELGYKIHLLYNLIAKPETNVFNSLNEQTQPTEFVWSLTGTPDRIPRARPACHAVVDSRTTDPAILELIENQLYGTELTAPSMPSLSDLAEFYGYLGALIIVDNGNGTWTAIDESDGYITMLNDTTFLIDDADTTYLNPVMYTISSTNVD
jgi:hypothetical protein